MFRRIHMRRVLITIVSAAALFVASRGLDAQGDGGYKLVANWPKLPAGMYFGLKDAPLPPAERDAQAAARRARGGTGGGQAAPDGGAANPPGLSRPALDPKENGYGFN